MPVQEYVMIAVRRSPLSLSPMFGLSSALSMLSALEESAPSVRAGEVTEADDSYTVTVPVPGLSREEITLSATDSTLTLEGARKLTVPEGFKVVHRERSDYRVSRRLKVPRAIDPDGITAELTDGVLTITVPKAASARLRQIAIR
jgi:HSP20 family protein